MANRRSRDATLYTTTFRLTEIALGYVCSWTSWRLAPTWLVQEHRTNEVCFISSFRSATWSLQIISMLFNCRYMQVQRRSCSEFNVFLTRAHHYKLTVFAVKLCFSLEFCLCLESVLQLAGLFWRRCRSVQKLTRATFWHYLDNTTRYSRTTNISTANST